MTYEINSHRSSETNYSAFDLTFGSGHYEYFHALGAESLEPIERYGHYIQDLDRRILKEAFRQAKNLQQRLKLNYQL